MRWRKVTWWTKLWRWLFNRRPPLPPIQFPPLKPLAYTDQAAARNRDRLVRTFLYAARFSRLSRSRSGRQQILQQWELIRSTTNPENWRGLPPDAQPDDPMRRRRPRVDQGQLEVWEFLTWMKILKNFAQ